MSIDNRELDRFLNSLSIKSKGDQLVREALHAVNLGRVSLHPYGFYIVKLRETPTQQTRVHIWLPGERRKQVPDWPLHNHSYHLNSYILEGRMEHSLWEVECSPSGSGRIYSVDYKDSSSVLRKNGPRVTYSAAETQLLDTNSSYQVEKYRFHSTVVDEDSSCITLCVFSEPSRNPPLVIGEHRSAKKLEFERLNLSNTENELVSKKLYDLFERLQCTE